MTEAMRSVLAWAAWYELHARPRDRRVQFRSFGRDYVASCTNLQRVSVRCGETLRPVDLGGVALPS
jgi:hypothetical protein